MHGVLGVGLRGDAFGIYSPLAQLGSPLSDGFTLRTGGFASETAELVLGAGELADVEPIALESMGALPNGLPAWWDDSIETCFTVDGAPTDPPCTPSVLDTGSNLDVLHANGLPASAIDADWLLAPGVTFGASHQPGFELGFTVAEPVTWSLDGVLVQQDEAFSILGLEIFFRHDVAYDILHGRIGLRPL
jgi:hypothetical protein